jgi:hypothetical protein
MTTIDEEIQCLGPLKNVAAAIVDYVAVGARQSKSEFHRYGYEWTLEPDPWINLHFVYVRKYRIHISLGVYPTTVDGVEGLDIKPGRFPSWSKITISSALQLPAAMRCIETAYYFADNRYRTKNGKPKRPSAA